jgi:hypothetical protein
MIEELTMDRIKPWYLSRTIWAGLVAIAVSTAGVFDYAIEEADAGALSDALMQTIGALAGLFAIFGRITARSRIG